MAQSQKAAIIHNHGTPTVEDIEESWAIITQTPTSKYQLQTPSLESQLKSLKCMDTSSSNNQPATMGDYTSFPELRAVQLDRKLASHAPRDLEIDARITRLEAIQNKSMKMMQLFVASKVRITAREILKRAIGAKSKKYGDGRQDYHKTHEVKRRIMLACRAYGLYGMHPNQESIDTFKSLAQSIIADNNDVGYVDTVEELQEMVKACVDSFHVYPNLLTNYSSQCQVIIQFGDFKKYLPEEFRILKL